MKPVLQNARLATIALALALVAFVPTARAGILVPGSTLNFSGAEVSGATVSNFQCNQPGDTTCNVAPVGSGDFAVASSTDSFAQYNGTFGLIKSTNNALQPLNQAFSLPNWITFDLNDQITLELTFFPLGNDTLSTDCTGLAHCTPANALLISPSDPSGLSGFNLDQNATGTSASVGFTGTAHANDSTTDAFSGIFTATFAGETPQQALASMLAGNAYSYSGSIVLAGTVGGPTGVPEPLTLSLFGAGLAGAVALRRRRRG